MNLFPYIIEMHDYLKSILLKRNLEKSYTILGSINLLNGNQKISQHLDISRLLATTERDARE